MSGPAVARETSKIPATVITGFLGAGKTSLIRNILETANGKRIALVINEFGDLGIDGEILKGCGDETCSEEDVVELANGCICCTVADDFVPTIEKLLAREDMPDHIVIETSGLALPKPLVKAFNWPEIRTRVTVDGVVTVVDADAASRGLFASDPAAVQEQREKDEALDHESPLEELYEDQLNCADMVILNKADLVDEEELVRVEKEVQEQIKRAVKVIHSAHGSVAAEVLLGLDSAAEDDLESRPSHHDGPHDHDHDDFESFHVDVPEISDPVALVAGLRKIVESHDILRIKGFLPVKGKNMRLLVQGVGTRFTHYFDREWREGEDRQGRLVIIGLHDFDDKGIRTAIADLKV